MNRNYNILKILQSCITGVAVWIYTGPSEDSARQAYHRARQHEASRIRHAARIVSRRKANVMKLLSDCMSALPLTGDLDRQRKQAARLLVSISEDGGPTANRDFYNHFQEEKRRMRKARSAFRKNESNPDYDK